MAVPYTLREESEIEEKLYKKLNQSLIYICIFFKKSINALNPGNFWTCVRRRFMKPQGDMLSAEWDPGLPRKMTVV